MTTGVWFAVGLLVAVALSGGYLNRDKDPLAVEGTFGANPFTLQSNQLADDPDNGECLITDGTSNSWSTSCGGGGGGGGSSFFGFTENTNILAVLESPTTTPTTTLSAYRASTTLLSGNGASGTVLVSDGDSFFPRATSTLGITSHDPVTLAGSLDYLTLSGQQITRGTIDFGDDTNAVGGTGITITGDSIAADLGTAIDSSEITNGTIVNDDINASAAIDYSKLNLAGSILEIDLGINAPTNGYLLVASSSATGDMEWTATTSSNLGLVQESDLHDAVTLAGTPDYITISGQTITRGTIDISDDTNLGKTGTPDYVALTGDNIVVGTVDIGDDTNLVGGNALTLSGDTLNFDGGATPGGELGGTWASPSIDDGLAVTNFNLTTPTFTTNFTFDGTTVTGLSGADVNVITGTAGTSGNCVEWNADGDIVDAGAACGTGGGGGGSLSTTTDKIGAGAAGIASYVNDNDFFLFGTSSTTCKFCFDKASSTLEIKSADTVSTTTWLSTDTTSSTRMGAGSQNSDDGWEIITGIEWVFNSATAILRGVGSTPVTAITTALDWIFTGSIDAGGATFFEIPNGTNPTANDVGEIAHDTTDNQLILDDRVIRTGEEIFKVKFASTSPLMVENATNTLPVLFDGYTVTDIACYVTDGTSKIVRLYGETITCAEIQTGVTQDDGSIGSGAVSALATTTLAAGADSGAWNWLDLTIYGIYTRE